MSWLSIPLPNPFKSLGFDDDDDDDDDEQQRNVSPHGADVQDDLSAIGESISRQFRGVAAFLAPPPDETATASPSSSAVDGIRSDLAEIGGTLKNTLSFLSNPNKAVSEISKLASDFLQLNEENTPKSVNNDEDEDEDDDDDEYDEDEYGGGVNDQVIDFARQISERRELWIDFPLSLQNLDFDMSEAQSEHASIVEQVVPQLADLRSRISSEKSEQQFWMIYFILLLPRLSADDVDLLSTPQIIEARETLLMMLRTKKSEENNPENSQSYSSSALDAKVDDAEPENSQSVGDVSTIENSKGSSNIEIKESDTTRKRLGVDDASAVTSTQRDPIPSNEVTAAHENVNYLREDEKPVSKRFQTEDDVSFSDLEDDDNDLPNRKPSSGSAQIKRNSSTEGSTDWVRLNEGSTKESNGKGQTSSRDRDSEGYESTDWLTVDDFDP